MAKRKRKKSSLGTSLKYEVYGILLISVSIIALSGEATVGRSLSKLFGLILGKFYFVIALAGVYVGLAVMVKRAWPTRWTSRKTGLLLLILALALMSSISVMDQKVEPTGGLTAGYIMSQLGDDIRSALLSPPLGQQDAPMLQKPISGGYAGAVQYALLYWLFGYFGAKFILIVMFIISIMLMTGRSYVDLIKMVRQRGVRLYSLFRMKLASRRPAALAVSSQGNAARNQDPVIDDDDFDDDDEDELPPVQPAGRKKKSLFFSWFNETQPKEDDTQAANDQEWMMDDEHSSVLERSKGRSPAAEWDDEQEEEPWTATGGTPSSPVLEQPSADRPPWEDGNEAEMISVGPGSGGGVLPNGQRVVQPVLFEDELGGAGKPALPESEALVSGEEGWPPAAPPRPAAKPYQLPSLSLLSKPPAGSRSTDMSDAHEARRKLEATLESFGVRAKVLDVVRGPAVTRYEVQPATGVKVSRIVGLTDDIALALAAKDIRMEAPIPGKSAIGIEVPNMEVSVVTMREVMETPAFQNASSKLSIAFGRDISGQPIVGNLAKMPHLLVAGATGSGKSVCINGIITSILYKARPDEVKFMMIDPKMVELNVYNGIPHLLAPVVTDPRRASLALKKIVVEMEKRYELFSKSGTRNIEGYNTLMVDNPSAVLPYIVVIVDELADLMMVAASDVEDAITRLAQMARAAGIHLIIATQRPSVDVITGVIKANIPSRIAFGVSSQVDSRTILDMAGAEKLLGRGDMLFLPVGMSKPIRVQGAFLSDQEVEAVVGYTRPQAEAEYKEDLVPEIEEVSPENDEMLDELFDQAARIVLEAKQASVSLLQRRMRIGYTRAARLVDQMEARGIVGPYEGSKPREVLMTIDQFDAGKISS
ncbi:FtsK/SpoIIIE family DNA translocase [Paenibacillus humicola]|uniref:FtsK/SpoIIIE family DNA translocase n=1 Tax=Paenibacillus humicola TaxID=3110540 RepID=UPI00237AF054|nr:DNA translocase FtsK [Paenibacillus humicola]